MVEEVCYRRGHNLGADLSDEFCGGAVAHYLAPHRQRPRARKGLPPYPLAYSLSLVNPSCSTGSPSNEGGWSESRLQERRPATVYIENTPCFHRPCHEELCVSFIVYCSDGRVLYKSPICRFQGAGHCPRCATRLMVHGSAKRSRLILAVGVVLFMSQCCLADWAPQASNHKHTS